MEKVRQIITMCKSCGFIWRSRTAFVPITCPNCKKRYTAKQTSAYICDACKGHGYLVHIDEEDES